MYRKYGNLKRNFRIIFSDIFWLYFSKNHWICNMKFPNFTKVNNHTNHKKKARYYLEWTRILPIHNIRKNALCMLESQLLAIYENINKKNLMHAHARFFFFFFGEWWTFATNLFFSKIWEKCSLGFLNSKNLKKNLKNENY